MNRTFRLSAAAVSALAVCSLSITVPAFAADPIATGGAPAANVALINDDASANLHLSKYSGAPTNGRNDGTPIGGVAERQGLAGVQYRISRVTGVDLTTNEGWQAAAAQYNGLAGGTVPATTDPRTGTTNAQGQLSFTGLPLGLYYVEEIKAPAGYTMAAPFLVTLPMTNPSDRTQWMYDVYVYPKNQADEMTKTVTDKGSVTTEDGLTYGAAGNHALAYTLTSSITDNNDPLGMYVIYDDLHPSVSFTGATLALTPGTALTAGTDYEVWTAATASGPFTRYTSGTVAGGPVVSIVMTDAGLAKLEANRGSSVTTTINATVQKRDADGVIENKASFVPNGAWWSQNGTPGVNPETPGTTPPGTSVPGIPSNEVLSKYGDVSITKYDGGDANAMLAGAEFAVFADANNDESCTVAEMVDANRIGGIVTTAANGVATFKGLQTSNFYDNATQSDLITYCLVETKAPQGYNLNADPIAFTVSQGADGNLALANLRVANEKTNLNNSLPLTGGDGIAMLSLAGLALIGGGAAYYAVSARKRRDA